MLDILGIGDAIVDKLIPFDVQDALMRPVLGVKGLFFTATEQEHDYLRNKPALLCCAGGSAANTIRNMSLLGFETGFVGKVGNDADGDFFEKDLARYKVHSYLQHTGQDRTGCSVVIVHSDKDRTQCAHTRASNLLMPNEISDECLKNTRAVLMEGYVLNRRPELVLDILERAVRFGVKFYFTLSDAHCVTAKKELIHRLCDKMDVIFGNEYEFDALEINLSDRHKTICVKTCGADGVSVFSANGKVDFKVSSVDNIVNTNGAGDAFAAGFLGALQQNKPWKECVLRGHDVARLVLKTEMSCLPITFKHKNM